MFKILLTLAYYRAEDVHQFCGFRYQFLSEGFLLLIATNIDKPESIAAFLGFLTTYLYAHQEVFLAERLIGLNVIGPDRSRRFDELLAILDIGNRSLQSFDELSHIPCKGKRPVLQVVLF